MSKLFSTATDRDLAAISKRYWDKSCMDCKCYRCPLCNLGQGDDAAGCAHCWDCDGSEPVYKDCLENVV